MKHGICAHHVLEMTPCNGKKCYECELSPAYKMGQKAAEDNIWPTMKEINDLVYQEGYDNGFKAGMLKAKEEQGSR